MKLKKKNNIFGFTLTELLASILVLAIICSITIYTAVNVVKSSKEKSYQVTINEVKKNANQYLTENNERLVFIPVSTDANGNSTGTVEYQCITVQNLIDYGYLDNNVVNSSISEKETVNKEDYIYIEKDINTKAIIKSVYPVSEEKDAADRCGLIVKGLGNITISSNPSINSWSKFKNITISYSLKNINDVNSTYNYTYSYTGKSSLDLVVKIGNVNITNFTLTNKNNGTYNLKINDLKNAGKVTITIEANKVLDKVVDSTKNGNDKTTLNPNIKFDNTYKVKYDNNGGTGCGTMTVTYDKTFGASGNLCVPTRSGYTFQGWYPAANNGTKIENSTKVTKAADQTIYAHWKEKPSPSGGGGGGCQCYAQSYCCNCGACYYAPTKK